MTSISRDGVGLIRQRFGVIFPDRTTKISTIRFSSTTTNGIILPRNTGRSVMVCVVRGVSAANFSLLLVDMVGL